MAIFGLPLLYKISAAIVLVTKDRRANGIDSRAGFIYR